MPKKIRIPRKVLMPKRINVPLNPAAKAVLPDGRIIGRRDVLKRLNLDPNTPVDAWLAIIGCGSNASALGLKDAKTLIDKGIITKLNLLNSQLEG